MPCSVSSPQLNTFVAKQLPDYFSDDKAERKSTQATADKELSLSNVPTASLPPSGYAIHTLYMHSVMLGKQNPTLNLCNNLVLFACLRVTYLLSDFLRP